MKWCVTETPQALLALQPATAEVRMLAFINSLRNEGCKLLSGLFDDFVSVHVVSNDGNKSAMNLAIVSPAVNKIILCVFFFKSLYQ